MTFRVVKSVLYKKLKDNNTKEYNDDFKSLDNANKHFFNIVNDFMLFHENAESKIKTKNGLLIAKMTSDDEDITLSVKQTIVRWQNIYCDKSRRNEFFQSRLYQSEQIALDNINTNKDVRNEYVTTIMVSWSC